MGKFINRWKLNDILLNNQWVKEEITREKKKYFEMNENEIEHTNLWNDAKAGIRWTIIAENDYVIKEEDLKLITKTSTLTF